ncbi:WAP four-disulfide core domain protein 2-like [Boleophthalmus pectinirostris]|uniref:WAP four-disulfide core domain protein 2-like n=1 Tax=Boleophthalmus pectinirostris TaxID=150288 RepID=UPI00242BDD6D|nr:WAP four-disulfide core domain protein 2-like [Boleophthalmus pectinirostris]
MKCSVLCLLAVAFVPLLSALKVASEKDGRCPVSFLNVDVPLGLCREQCSTDRDCEGNLKCCYSGCDRLCQEPLRVSTEVPKPKPGSCPKPKGFVDCTHTCKSDQDCKDNLKCCSNRCGRTCQKPVKRTKPGSCPAPIPHVFKCLDQCSDDSECDKNFKCCYSGCGYECKSPEHGNHGNMGE